MCLLFGDLVLFFYVMLIINLVFLFDKVNEYGYLLTLSSFFIYTTIQYMEPMVLVL